jgi:hypothetical protein
MKDTRDELISLLTEAYFALRDLTSAPGDMPGQMHARQVMARIDNHLGIEEWEIQRHVAVEMGLIKQPEPAPDEETMTWGRCFDETS